jgi:peroxiredoxin
VPESASESRGILSRGLDGTKGGEGDENVVRDVTLTVAVVVAAVLAAAGVHALLKPASEPPAVASAPTGAAPADTKPTPKSGLSLEEAVRELDLIRPARPKRAEDFAVTLVQGDTLTLKEQRGKAVMVNFWATWCPPCREEMPAMERLHRRHQARGFVLLAVSVDTDAALVKPFLAQHKLTFPVALDAKMELANAYGVRALPASFLIDREGNLAALALGPRAWDNKAAHALVERLLAP